MTAMNKKHAINPPKARAANRSKNDAREEQKAYVRSLSDAELMRRLGGAADTPIALQQAHGTTQEPGANEVRERNKAIKARAQKATGVTSEEVATTLAVQAAAIPVGGNVGGGPERARTIVQAAVEMLEQIKPEGALQSMLAAQMIGVHNTAIKFLMRPRTRTRLSREQMRMCCARLVSCGCLTNSCRALPA